LYEEKRDYSNSARVRSEDLLKINKAFLDRISNFVELAHSELDIVLLGNDSLRFVIDCKIVDFIVSQKLSKNMVIRILCSIAAEKKLLQKYIVPFIGFDSVKLTLPESSMSLIQFTRDKKELVCFSFNRNRTLSTNQNQVKRSSFKVEEWFFTDQIPFVKSCVLSFEMLWQEKEKKDNLLKEKMHSELLFDLLSHDIGNYLQIIQNSLDIVTLSEESKTSVAMTDSENKEEILSYLTKAQKAIDKSQLLLKNLRQLERLYAQKDLKLIPKNLPEVINNAYNTVRQSIRNSKSFEKNIVFSLGIVDKEIHPADINMIGEDLLEEIFVNLFSNSVKYTLSSDVAIEVLIREYFIAETKYWMVTVSDHGKGIPDSIKNELFDRFYSKAGGSGLGLSIARTLVERYKGKIWVGDRIYNEYNRGTTFGMIFPALKLT
jgi:signal transduction histidine kinase